MEINVEVKLESKKSQIIKLKNSDKYYARIKSQPKNNMANKELVDIVSKEFKVSAKSIKIIKGQKSTHKILLIKDGNI
jgi:uncharacterized protein (TIGR00251 family)